VAAHEPAVFVLENVKGLLTSRHGGRKIVTRILDDLSAPGKEPNPVEFAKGFNVLPERGRKLPAELPLDRACLNSVLDLVRSG